MVIELIPPALTVKRPVASVGTNAAVGVYAIVQFQLPRGALAGKFRRMP